MTMQASGNASWQPSSDGPIKIDWVEANGMTFEVAMADPITGFGKGDSSSSGDGDKRECAGEHLALCLHGFPELHYSWRHQMEMLAQMGYRVWAPNMRGFGGSSRPDGISEYTLDKLVADVAALIDASGAKKVTLFAHDWGGVVGWAFAILQPRVLERFVVMNLPHPFVFKRELKNWRQLKKSWYIYFFQIPWLPEKLLGRNGARGIGRIFAKTSCNPDRFSSEDQAVYSQAANRPGALTAMVNYYRAIVRHRDALNLGRGKVDVPTLMVWGEQDLALDIQLTKGTDQWVEDFTLKRLPNASHWVQQDVPDEVNGILKDWLPPA